MANNETPREASINLAASHTRPDNAIRGIAFALIYVGDQIGQVSDGETAEAIERVATELGALPQAIQDLATEVAS